MWERQEPAPIPDKWLCLQVSAISFVFPPIIKLALGLLAHWLTLLLGRRRGGWQGTPHTPAHTPALSEAEWPSVAAITCSDEYVVVRALWCGQVLCLATCLPAGNRAAHPLLSLPTHHTPHSPCPPFHTTSLLGPTRTPHKEVQLSPPRRSWSPGWPCKVVLFITCCIGVYGASY